MREILFKAKTESGRWIEGDLIHYQSGEVAIIEKPFSKYGHEATEICGRTLVLPDTLCQYTGLTDKNGNKIWENDICSTDIKRPYAIVDFRNGCFMYNLNDGEEDYYDIMIPVEPLVDSDKYTEVIGNIFDNPELAERN